MNLAFTLILCGSLSAQADSLANLDFHTGTLAGWEGEGFYVTPAGGHGPTLACGVCSGSRGSAKKPSILHRTIVVPADAGAIQFTANVVRGKDCPADENLDVILLGPKKRIIPKQVRGASDWVALPRLLAADKGKAREYIWPIANYAGQTLRIAIVDEDKRPGSYLFCSGFRIIPNDIFEGRQFGQFMVRLARDQKLPPVARFDSKHFMAFSNADDNFTELRLNNCELIYDLFYDHFRDKGFRLRAPATKMMVAIFDSQAGFEAYVGHAMPATVTGLYHPGTNRLLVYDYGQNHSFVNSKRVGEQEARRSGGDLDRRRNIETLNRRAQEFRTEANIGTIMHEVAHQLSFNSGMLNREGDVPLWLAEGLACYCEATDNGSWQGVGEANPERFFGLAGPFRGQGQFIPLRELIISDAWLRGPHGQQNALVGYAQSWALFRLLMEERPEAMRAYLKLIYQRKTPDHRLPDFAQAFGADQSRLELRYGEYMKGLVDQFSRQRR